MSKSLHLIENVEYDYLYMHKFTYLYVHEFNQLYVDKRGPNTAQFILRKSTSWKYNMMASSNGFFFV